MRRAFNDYQIWTVEDKFVGFSLGYDFTSEHEWGIDDMKRILGIPESSKKTMGIKSRTITRCPDNLIFIEETYKGNKCALLYTGSRYYNREESEKYISTEIKDYKEEILRGIKYDKEHPSARGPKDPIITAWDSGTFGIGVVGEKESEYLKELYKAFQEKNVAVDHINLMPNNPFSNSSLSLLILDKIPEEIKSAMYYSDKKHFDLIDYEKKIGMTRLKEKTRRGYSELHYYLACSPRWIDYKDPENRKEEKEKIGTKYDIQYWINYSDDDNNFGWYTVEEIKEWLTGTKKLTEIRRAYNPNSN